MPAAKKRTEVYVGLFILIGLVMLGGLVVQFGRFRENFSGTYGLTVVFDDASGVIRGSEIRMGGARIGEVASVPVLNEAVRVEVPLAITESIRIPTGSQFLITSATLLGDKLIVVAPPADRTSGFIPPGSLLEGSGLTGIDAIQSNAEEVTKDVLRIIREAEASFAKVDAAVDEIRGAGTQLQAAMTKINGTMLSEKNLRRFDETLENLASTTGRWNAASTKLDPTLEDARDAITAVKKAAAKAEATLESANQAFSEIKPSLKRIPGAVDDFSSTTRKAGRALDRINNGEGVIGALAADNDVALDVKTFMKNLKNHGILFYRNPEVEAAREKAENKGKPEFTRFGPRGR